MKKKMSSTYTFLQFQDLTVDLLEYWKIHENQFLLISVIAKYSLSIPCYLVAIECIFNCGRDVIVMRRHFLASATLRKKMFEKLVLK